MPPKDTPFPLSIPAVGAEKTPGEVLSAGAQWAPAGIAGGALLSGVKSLLTGGDFLRDTLSGALLGGLGAGGTKAYLEADPFQRGGMAGKALQSAALGAGQSLLAGEDIPGAGLSGVQSAIGSLLAGRGRFTPQEQQSLVQQFTQAVLPTQKGWANRRELMKRVANALMSKRPRAAMPGLKLLERIAPDVDVSTLAQHARERILGGRFKAPEEQTALRALGKRLAGALKGHEKMTPFLEQLRGMKEQFATGDLDAEGLAKRVGILTGRFGPMTEEAQEARNAMQQLLARQIPRRTMSETERRALSTPQIGELIEQALERGRTA